MMLINVDLSDGPEKQDSAIWLLVMRQLPHLLFVRRWRSQLDQIHLLGNGTQRCSCVSLLQTSVTTTFLIQAQHEAEATMKHQPLAHSPDSTFPPYTTFHHKTDHQGQDSHKALLSA